MNMYIYAPCSNTILEKRRGKTCNGKLNVTKVMLIPYQGSLGKNLPLPGVSEEVLDEILVVEALAPELPVALSPDQSELTAASSRSVGPG